MVPPGDAPALAAALEQLDDATLRARLGTAGRRRWASDFTLEQSARAMRRLYGSVLA
jgi:glycosyltransferase involved in cell wall biosynthesis